MSGQQPKNFDEYLNQTPNVYNRSADYYYRETPYTQKRDEKIAQQMAQIRATIQQSQTKK